jgi:glycosyltransferase involved in cell wall biosynthesis
VVGPAVGALQAATDAALTDHPHRPSIAPVPPGGERPLWSVMIPAYNCAPYLGRTIESVLSQDPGPKRMQVEVVDDCSSDDPAGVVARFGDRVSLYRQARNLGNVGNFNTCLARARGHLVHLLHGDDAVRDGFYERLGEALQRHPGVGAAFCRYVAMDENGNWTNTSQLEATDPGVLADWLESLALGQRLQPPCIAVRRQIYERLGGFDDRLSYGEDWEMWTRIAAHYPVWYEPAPLAVYRIHTGTVSDRTLRSGKNVADLRRAIAINRESLPPGRTEEITHEALRITALTALRRGRRRLGAGDTEAAAAQLREALVTSRSPRVLAGALFLAALYIRRWTLVRLGRR